MSYDVVISLGARCLPGLEFRRMLLSAPTMPFDWIVSPPDSSVRAIETKFEGAMARETLSFHAKELTGHVNDFIRDDAYGFEHWHDFEDPRNYATSYPAVAQKRKYIVDRFFMLLLSRQRILFVRRELDGMGSLAWGTAFVKAISRYRQPETFCLAYLGDTVPDFRQPSLHCVNTPTGNLTKEAWNTVMDRIHSEEKIIGYHPAAIKAMNALFPNVRRRIYKAIRSLRKRKIEASIAFAGPGTIRDKLGSLRGENRLTPTQ